jgi:hypothetical protein
MGRHPSKELLKVLHLGALAAHGFGEGAVLRLVHGAVEMIVGALLISEARNTLVMSMLSASMTGLTAS